MFGGTCSQLVVGEQYVVAQYSRQLVVLDTVSLKKKYSLDKDVITFGIYGQQLVIVDAQCKISFYLLQDGEEVKSLVLQNTQKKFIYGKLKGDYFIYISAGKLMSYNIFEKKYEKIMDIDEDILNGSASVINVDYNGLIFVLTIDTHIFIKNGDQLIHKSYAKTITAIALSSQLLAVGDTQGKIVIYNVDLTIFYKPTHWHAHKINSLALSNDQEYFYSAGKEGVLVQWHMQSQRKVFFARQGNEIACIGMNTIGDKAFLALKGTNSIKEVDLQGGDGMSTYEGVQSNGQHCKVLQINQKHILSNGVQGTLQVLDVLNGKFHKVVDICKKNYVSDTEQSDQRRQELDITDFSVSSDGSSLACVVQLSNEKYFLSSLKFFVKNQSKEFVCVTTINKPHITPILGITHYNSTDWQSEIFVTWDKSSIRLWKGSLNQEKQNFWSCIHFSQFEGILAVDVNKQNKLIITTTESLLYVNPFTNKVENQLTFKKQPENSICSVKMSQDYVVKLNGNKLLVLDLNKSTQSQSTLKVDDIQNMHIVDHRLIFSGQLNKNGIVIIYDLVTNKIEKALSTNLQIKHLFTFQASSILYLYLVDSANHYLKVCDVIQNKPKKSLMEEEEEVEENQNINEGGETTQNQQLQQFDQAFQSQLGSVTNLFDRMQFSDQARIISFQSKEFNIGQFFPTQSHLIPSLSVIAKRLLQFTKKTQDQNTIKSQPQQQIGLAIEEEINIKQNQYFKIKDLPFQEFLLCKDMFID